jgi:hypothetical protein
MHQTLVSFTLAGLMALAGSPRGSFSVAGEGEVVPVMVTNFPDTVQVEGSVAVKGPIRRTTLATIADVVVPPIKRDDTNHFIDAGVIATDGFVGTVLSLLGEFKGQPQRAGDVGAILLPDDEFVIRALTERGQLLLAEEVKTLPTTAASPYFAAKPVRFTVAYPRYRVFLYNACDKSVSLTVHAYLTD